MRYIVLVMLNLPIVLLACTNLVTKYKLKKIDKERFKTYILLWLVVFATVAGSFPVYNCIIGNSPLSSEDLSVFDIVQTTVIILLIYIANSQRQKIELIDRRLRRLHSELSIKLSDRDDKTLKR